MRADRLLSILLLLQTHGKMSSRELSERLEVSERTIHRDMEALSAGGVPVFAHRGTNGGWELSEGYRTQLTGLKIDEIQSLLVMNPSQVLKDLGMNRNYESAFLKLLAALPPATRRDAEYVRDRIHVDGAGWHPTDEKFPLLPIVQEAVWEERKLYIQYPKGDTVTERLVDPLGLVAKSHTWYLVAATDGDFRSYRISRMTHARMSEEHFARPVSFDLAAFWEASMTRFKANLPRYPAVVKFHEKLLPRIRQARYVKLVHTGPGENEWIVADIEFDTLEFACEYIISHGPLMEVLEPGELQAMVIEQAKAILAKYAERRYD